jgi:signal transduction histidine kinase
MTITVLSTLKRMRVLDAFDHSWVTPREELDTTVRVAAELARARHAELVVFDLTHAAVKATTRDTRDTHAERGRRGAGAPRAIEGEALLSMLIEVEEAVATFVTGAVAPIASAVGSARVTAIAMPLMLETTVVGAVQLGWADATRLGAIPTDALRALARMASNQIGLMCARVEAERRKAVTDKRTLGASQLIASMCHELRTPLNAVALGAEMAMAGQSGEIADPRLRAALAEIVINGARLVEVVERTLELAAHADGGVRSRATAVAILPMIEAVVSGLDPTGVRISVNAEALAALHVHGDADQIARVIAALARNAIEATGADGRVEITGAFDPTLDRVDLLVSDDGPGVPDAVIQRLGEPFNHGFAERAAAGGGIGMGLALARRLAELNRGRLMLHRRDPHGTRAYLSLPGWEQAVRTTDAAD